MLFLLILKIIRLLSQLRRVLIIFQQLWVYLFAARYKLIFMQGVTMPFQYAWDTVFFNWLKQSHE